MALSRLAVPVALALAPLLLVQAVGVRSRALRLPEAAGPRSGTAGDGPPLRLLILGDSAAAGVGVARQDDALSGQLVSRLAVGFRVDWRLVATTGHRTRDAEGVVAALAAQPFDACIISLGVNDITSGMSPRRWIARQARLHALLRRKFGVRLIVMAPMPPMGSFPLLPQPLRWVLGQRADAFNRVLDARAALDPHLHVARFALPADPSLMAEDGYHPGPAIYAAWAAAVAEAIKARLG